MSLVLSNASPVDWYSEDKDHSQHRAMRIERRVARGGRANVATCDTSDVLRKAREKWGEDRFRLEWSEYDYIIESEVIPKADAVAVILTNSQPSDESLVNFNRLARTWRESTAGCSITTRRYAHSSYQEILVMGKSVVPLILRELQERPDWWFEALKALTKQDPTKPTDNFRDAVKAWLKWGKDMKVI